MVKDGMVDLMAHSYESTHEERRLVCCCSATASRAIGPPRAFPGRRTCASPYLVISKGQGPSKLTNLTTSQKNVSRLQRWRVMFEWMLLDTSKFSNDPRMELLPKVTKRESFPYTWYI